MSVDIITALKLLQESSGPPARKVLAEAIEEIETGRDLAHRAVGLARHHIDGSPIQDNEPHIILRLASRLLPPGHGK